MLNKFAVASALTALVTSWGLFISTPADAQEADPLVCPVLAIFPGQYVPGVIDIEPEGDVNVLGEPFWDCPPYDEPGSGGGGGESILVGFSLMAAHSQKCLDVEGASDADGAFIHQWGCHGGRNQQWSIENIGNDGTFRLVGVDSGKCLHSPDSTEGSRLVQQTCNSSANQRWSVAADRAGLMFRASNSGMCIDVFAFNLADGAHVVQWRCNIGYTNQQFIPR